MLNEIAILDKRGPYNNCYHLKPEYSQQSSNASESIAPLGLEAPAAGTSNEVEDDDFEFDRLRLDDLEVVATLGVGGFGRVELVQVGNSPPICSFDSIHFLHFISCM